MPRVRNVLTGVEHDVPPGHFSLSSGEYELVAEPEPVKEPAKEPAPAKTPAKPKSKSKK